MLRGSVGGSTASLSLPVWLLSTPWPPQLAVSLLGADVTTGCCVKRAVVLSSSQLPTCFPASSMLRASLASRRPGLVGPVETNSSSFHRSSEAAHCSSVPQLKHRLYHGCAEVEWTRWVSWTVICRGWNMCALRVHMLQRNTKSRVCIRRNTVQCRLLGREL